MRFRVVRVGKEAKRFTQGQVLPVERGIKVEQRPADMDARLFCSGNIREKLLLVVPRCFGQSPKRHNPLGVLFCDDPFHAFAFR